MAGRFMEMKQISFISLRDEMNTGGIYLSLKISAEKT